MMKLTIPTWKQSFNSVNICSFCEILFKLRMILILYKPHYFHTQLSPNSRGIIPECFAGLSTSEKFVKVIRKSRDKWKGKKMNVSLGTTAIEGKLLMDL